MENRKYTGKIAPLTSICCLSAAAAVLTGFVAALKEVGYAGTLNLEIKPPDSEKDLTAEFVRKAMRCARRLLV